MPSLTLKPLHKAVSIYYDPSDRFTGLGIKYEITVRSVCEQFVTR